jgi:dTDP-4-amino-4,6-dideoxygalactose transaminase
MQWPKQHLVDQADEERLLIALRQENWSSGEQTREFELRFAAFCGCKHALLVVNCTAAIKLALLSAGIGPGDEVIVPGLTWPSVAIAVIECGAEPVSVDIDPATYCVTASAIEAGLTERTRAIIPTHLFCSQADMPPILELARRKGIVVIEDAAHSAGARRLGKVSGTFGDAGCISFNQKKLLACGEGGCIITDDDDLYSRAKRLRAVDPEPDSIPSHLPGTYLASEFQAAVLTSQLEKLPIRLRTMESNAELLRTLLSRCEGVHVLERLDGTALQTFYAFCFKVLGLPDVAAFRRELSETLELSVSGAYAPLDNVRILDTSNDKRYSLLGKRLRRPLPNCHRAHYAEAVRLRHNFLLAAPEAMELVADSISRLVLNHRSTTGKTHAAGV